MARTKFIPTSVCVALFGLTACAPSPLYVRQARSTVGEVPRDGRGEPDWAAIRPAPPMPPPAIMPVPPGLAIVPPPGAKPRN